MRHYSGTTTFNNPRPRREKLFLTNKQRLIKHQDDETKIPK
ncbi:11028_t:CDS:1, partial [Gigaspora rosea]